MQKQVLKVITVILLAAAVAVVAVPTLSWASTKPITVVWYPNESANDYVSSRTEFGRLIEQATGRKVEHRLTTDYVIAIEALASGAADIGAVMGAVGYIEAKNKNPNVDVLFVNSGVSGTLNDAVYYSWLCVNKEDAGKYNDGGKYSITNIQGKKMSFVSNSSTSGFKVPTSSIISFFGKTEQWKNINVDDMVEGGSKAFFNEVLFGGSHQGSAFNLLSGKADIAAYCDTEMAPYASLKEGAESRVGSVYAVKPDAAAPFNTVTGKECVIIASTPVLNGPNAYNPQNLSAEEIKNIREIFTSEETANNENFFYKADSGNVGFYKKTNNERYLLVDDSWYNPIREM
jgi:phosphonate transport system substrate-binding protein